MAGRTLDCTLLTSVNFSEVTSNWNTRSLASGPYLRFPGERRQHADSHSHYNHHLLTSGPTLIGSVIRSPQRVFRDSPTIPGNKIKWWWWCDGDDDVEEVGGGGGKKKIMMVVMVKKNEKKNKKVMKERRRRIQNNDDDDCGTEEWVGNDHYYGNDNLEAMIVTCC